MSLFECINHFDDAVITLDDESIDGSGPFIVTMVYNDEAICSPEEPIEFKFDALKDAFEKFSELIREEIESVIDEI